MSHIFFYYGQLYMANVAHWLEDINCANVQSSTDRDIRPVYSHNGLEIDGKNN